MDGVPAASGQLVGAIRTALAARGDPERAVGQQRYMKSALPFHGLTVPQVRALVRKVVAAHPVPDRASWLAAVTTLWDEATHREQRYAAIGVLRDRRYRDWLIPDEALLGLVRHLVTSGAWWDLVDELSHVAGDLLASDRPTMTAVLRGWSREQDLWLRRVSIIAQLGAREATDVELLTYAVEGSIDDPDFFARKAIGWALRDYSKTDAAWVRKYVAAQASRLSPLSRREALKWLEAQATAD
ncbi:DNA alkylation repair protein [Micropruina sp.]|uniref:DNA alkylation repair protein n=1 Tax=Micropruina sp. TaxID=2737536 RepID=UPI0026274575|nr:DNA alkylation repair protein [Micropruina sp.]